MTRSASFYRAFAFVAFVVACAAARANAEEPRWVLNNGDDVKGVLVGQGRVVSEFGLFSVLSQGTDMTLTPSMSDKKAFQASERPFFALRYNAKTKQKFGGLFFTNDVNLPALSDKSYSQFEIVGDESWRNLIVDMRKFPHGNWKGGIKSIRLDPTNPSDKETRVSISRFGFFASEDDARAFLAEADDEPNYDMETELTNEFSRCRTAKGVLKQGYNRDDYLLVKPCEKKIDPDDRESFVVARTAANGAFVVDPLCDVTSMGYATYVASEPGARAIVRIDGVDRLSDVQKSKKAPAVRFAVARELMTPVDETHFKPEEKLSPETAREIVAKLDSLKAYGSVGERVAALRDRFLDVSAAPISREDAAELIADATRDALGTRVGTKYDRAYFERDRLRIGAWGNFQPRDYNEDYMRVYADCGFDFLLSLAVSPTELLKDADKYGVEVYVNDGSYRNPKDGAKEYCDHPSYTGCFVVDEPGSDDYDKLAEVCNRYTRETGKTAYINLLPMYANAAQLKYGAGAAAIEYYDPDPDLFRKYCAAFCDKIEGKYICTDIYPLNWKDDKKFTYPDYVESINIIASVAREYNREFWCYIQTFAWIPSKRTPTEAEYRWQCYSMLSFGCKCILCWTYAGYKDDFPSLVDINSRKSPAWYDARPVFWELRRLSDEYVKYRNLGAFTHNCSDETPYLKMTNEYRDFDAIKAIDCDDPLLVGCFEKKDDSRSAAFTLVNMVELEEARGTTVRVQIDAPYVVAWYRGVPQRVEPDREGWVDINLANGEGVFVTLP